MKNHNKVLFAGFTAASIGANVFAAYKYATLAQEAHAQIERDPRTVTADKLHAKENAAARAKDEKFYADHGYAESEPQVVGYEQNGTVDSSRRELRASAARKHGDNDLSRMRQEQLAQQAQTEQESVQEQAA